MKQLQLLCRSFVTAVLVSGIWAIADLIFGPTEAWAAAGGAAGGMYWVCNSDRSYEVEEDSE